MKKKGLCAFAALLLLAACASQPDTELSDTNIKYETWSAEKLFNLLPDEARMAVCDFNAEAQVLDSTSSSYSECGSQIMTYEGKHGYILKDNTTECQSIGRSDDMVYYDKKGLPVLHFIQRYLPATDMMMQVLVLFENGTYKNAFSRSAYGRELNQLAVAEFSTYEPMLSEDKVEPYEK